jgi:hypothetical protein
VTPRVGIEDQVVKIAVPEGSRFKGHEPFLVQDGAPACFRVKSALGLQQRVRIWIARGHAGLWPYWRLLSPPWSRSTS